MNSQIKFKQFQINELKFIVDKVGHSPFSKIETSFYYLPSFSDRDNNLFFILFSLSLQDSEKAFFLDVKATAYFETDTIINEDFKASSFVKVSAPAIAFPYLRTFISNFTLNSGYDPIILPSFNFVKIAEENQNMMK